VERPAQASKPNGRANGAILLFCFLFCCLLATRCCRAFHLPSYDLDSLAFLATDIVEGRIESNGFHVTAVHRGALKIGETIKLPSFDNYVKGSANPFKPGGNFGGGSPLAVGDRLVLFLTRDSDDEPGQSSATGPLSLVSSGIKLIKRGCVYDSIQWANPGPYVVDTTRYWYPTGLTTLFDFRQSLAVSMAKANELHSRFRQNQSKPDVTWLLKLLKQRAEAAPPMDDVIASEAAKRLAASGDLPAIESAIIDGGVDEISGRARLLGDGFESPDGVDFLLRELSNKGLPYSKRLLLIPALRDCNVNAVTRNPSDPKEVGSFFARVASLAVANTQDEQFCAKVIDALRYQVRLARNRGEPMNNAHFKDASALLVRLYREPTTSGFLRFHIQVAVAEMGDQEYQNLGGSAGPMACLAKPPGPNAAAPFGSSILVNCEYEWLRGGRVTAASLVVEADDHTATYEIPSKVDLAGRHHAGDSGGGDDCVPLPQGLRPGKYRLFYRFKDGNKVVGEGHGFVTNLPQSLVVIPRSAYLTSPAALAIRPRLLWSMFIAVPIVALLLLSVLHLYRSIRRRRRLRRGLCIDCGYDLRAATERCPECGSVLPQKLPKGAWKRVLRVTAFAGAAACLLASIVLWPLSFRSGYRVRLTSSIVSGSIYCTRGDLVLEEGDTDGDGLLAYDHGDPREFPRCADEAGAVTGWRFLGAEFSPDAQIVVIPFWFIALISALALAELWRPRKRGATAPAR